MHRTLLLLAVPHNILWWHEIVNLDFPDLLLAVTYCPLTGSGIVFDRADVGGAAFAVRGGRIFDEETSSAGCPRIHLLAFLRASCINELVGVASAARAPALPDGHAACAWRST